jgi:hypothetical protein
MKHTGLLPRDQENRALGAPLHLQKICSRHWHPLIPSSVVSTSRPHALK